MLTKMFLISLLNHELVHHHVVLVVHVHQLVIRNYIGLVMAHHHGVGCVG